MKFAIGNNHYSGHVPAPVRAVANKFGLLIKPTAETSTNEPPGAQTTTLPPPVRGLKFFPFVKKTPVDTAATSTRASDPSQSAGSIRRAGYASSSPALDGILEAQNSDLHGGPYVKIRKDLENGTMPTRSMWYIFPQLKSLSHGVNAKLNGITDLNEAVAYLNHPTLGRRLEECCRLVLEQNGSIEKIFGREGAKQFQSSMTLFAKTAPDNDRLKKCLEKCGGPDRLTLNKIR